MKKREFISAAVLLLMTWACTSSQPQYRIVTLPSGKQVRVVSIQRITFPQGPPAMMLSYQTDLKVSDKARLQREVEEIWPELKKDVEANNFSAAVISANEVPTGVILKRSNAFNFVFNKQADGSWKMQ